VVINEKSLLPLLAVTPAVITGGLIYAYGVNVPFRDQWDCPGVVLLKAHGGSLRFGDLLAQLTGWNPRYETLLTFIGACLVSFNIYFLLKRTSTITLNTRLALFFW
jgi:hypothetical protein